MNPWFSWLDAQRRWQGRMLDAYGLGRLETPHRCIHARPGFRLRHYPAPQPGQAGLLIVAAPVKRPYIWDLWPERSVVRRAMDRRLEVFLLEWTDETEPDAGVDLQTAAGGAVEECLDAIRAAGFTAPVFLAGHSLGGTLAALYAAYRSRRVAGLVLIEAPLHFTGAASGAFRWLLEFGGRAAAMEALPDRIPGTWINLVSVAAAPDAFLLERLLDRMASVAAVSDLLTHCRVERWILDEFALPRPMFEDVVELLYVRDLFMRGGLRFGRVPVRPGNITAPLFVVYGATSRIVPPASVLPFYEAAASRNRRLLAYRGDRGASLQHVGALVGAGAHGRLWPEIFDWLPRVSATSGGQSARRRRPQAESAWRPSSRL